MSHNLPSVLSYAESLRLTAALAAAVDSVVRTWPVPPGSSREVLEREAATILFHEAERRGPKVTP